MTHRFFIFPKKCDFQPEDAIFSYEQEVFIMKVD